MAVVLSAGLYSTSFLFGSLGWIEGLALFVLPVVAGITSVVLSRRKGFDGLVPALMSSLLGGVIVFILDTTFVSPGNSSISILEFLFLFGVLSPAGASGYIFMKKIG